VDAVQHVVPVDESELEAQRQKKKEKQEEKAARKKAKTAVAPLKPMPKVPCTCSRFSDVLGHSYVRYECTLRYIGGNGPRV
jgi:hypothetical protein